MREMIVVELLRVLGLSKGYKLPERTLFGHTNIRLGQPEHHDVLTENLQFAQGKGWVQSDLDTYRQPRHWISQSGEIELSRYQ